MICAPCKNERHDECPAWPPIDELTGEELAPYRSTLCDCQHKIEKENK
jgi:hypothetical protein